MTQCLHLLRNDCFGPAYPYPRVFAKRGGNNAEHGCGSRGWTKGKINVEFILDSVCRARNKNANARTAGFQEDSFETNSLGVEGHSICDSLVCQHPHEAASRLPNVERESHHKVEVFRGARYGAEPVAHQHSASQHVITSIRLPCQAQQDALEQAMAGFFQ